MTKWIVNLKIAQKLSLGFGTCLTLALVIAGASITQMAQMNEVTHSIVSDSLKGEEALGKFQTAAECFRKFQYRFGLERTNIALDITQGLLDKTESEANDDLSNYQKTVSDPQDSQNLQAVQTAWAEYLTYDQPYTALARKNDDAGTGAMMLGPMKASFDQVEQSSQTMADWKHQRAIASAQKADQVFKTSCIFVFGILAAGFVLAGLLGSFIVRSMTKAIAEIVEKIETLNKICVTNLAKAVTALENGDLTVNIVTGSTPLNIESHDEIGQLGKTFNSMLETVVTTIGSFGKSQAALSRMFVELQATARQVETAATSLAGTSQQIGASTDEITATMQEVSQASDQSARGADEVAKGSSAQAASISEGADLVKQLAASVRSVASDSETAEQVAQTARTTALSGVTSVKDTVTGMHSIQRTIAASAEVIQTLGDSSKQIGTIVQTIEEIADQTNLLALNAAIEAARAGDAGRGFAVVADEVRKLAERSRGATEEIGGLIEKVQTQTARAVAAMEGGVKEVTANTIIAERAGDTLTQIQTAVDQVTDKVHSIFLSAGEMKLASDDVSRSISDVAAVIEESSAAAEEMSASAEQVSASVATVAATTNQQSSAVESLVTSASELSSVAATLSEMISRFKVNASDSYAAPTKLNVSRENSAPRRKAA